MRILVSTSTFPVRSGDGIPRFILDLAQALSHHADVTVLSPDAPGAVLRERMGDIDVERFCYFWPRSYQRLAITNERGMRDNLRSSFLAQLQAPLFLWREVAALRDLVRRGKFDVVNAHWLVPQGLAAACALRRSPHVKLVLHIHAGDVYLLNRLPVGRRLAQYVVRRADAIFAAGSHVRDTLNELVGWDVGARLQPMGVHLERFRQSAGRAELTNDLPQQFPSGYLLFVGRLVEKKGATYLIRAMSEIQQREPDLGLVVAGFGPEEDVLRAEAARLNLRERVCFVGKKSHEEIVQLMQSCRVAVVPSIIDSRGETEGMPTVVTEALAAGALVVASAVAGVPDVLRDGENGWLCRPRDESHLAEKILTALSEPEPSPIREAALATAEKYDWQQVAQNYMNCLRQPTLEPQEVV